MAAILIFWAALLALLFYVVGIVVKALIAAMDALVDSGMDAIVILYYAFVICVAMYLLTTVADAYAAKGLGSAIWSLISQCIVFAVIAGGSFLLFIGIRFISPWVILAIALVLVKISDLCEFCFSKCLAVLTKRIEQG